MREPDAEERKSLLNSVSGWFNQPREIDLRVGEQESGFTEAEEKLLRNLPPRSEVLDIGCAAGRISLLLARAGHRVTGIDVARSLIEQAQQAAQRQGVDVSFQVCDPVRLPFPDGAFHAALLLKTYCYVPGRGDRIGWLNEIARAVKPGGQLFLSQYIIDDVLGSYEPIQEENRSRFPKLADTLEPGDGFSLPAGDDEKPGFVHYFMETDLMDELRSSRFRLVDVFREETICYCSLTR